MLFMVIVLLAKPVKLEVRLLLVVMAALISLFANNVEERYNAPVRLIIWCLLVLAVGPLLYNAKLIIFRKVLYEHLMVIFMLVGGLSFFWRFGLPRFGMGHFSGALSHSMLLAPVASLGGLFAFYRFIHANAKQKNVYLVLFLLNSICVVLASSRSAAAAYAVGFMVYLVFSRFSWRKTSIVGMCILIAYLAIGIDQDALLESESVSDTVFTRENENTRETLWNERIKEFQSSPLFGVGFATQDDKVVNEKNENEAGQLEPGSTYLMILSMMGITGGITVLFFILKPLLSRKFWRQVVNLEQYKLASLLFFLVHFLAEGYIFAAGSLLAFSFWTLIGAIYPYSGIRVR